MGRVTSKVVGMLCDGRQLSRMAVFKMGVPDKGGCMKAGFPWPLLLLPPSPPHRPHGPAVRPQPGLKATVATLLPHSMTSISRLSQPKTPGRPRR